MKIAHQLKAKSLILAAIILTAVIFSPTGGLSAAVWTVPASAGNEDVWPAVADIEATSYMVIDLTDGKTLLADHPDDRVFPASTTKIMTALLALETGDLDQVITVSAQAVQLSANASKAGLLAGEQITLRDALAGLMLVSGNDAATAIAETLAGSTNAFAERMNARAEELGMTSTLFVNANGLHDANHYTTARDMTILAAAAWQYPLFRELAALERYSMPPTNLHPYSGWGLLTNTNRFLQFGNDVLGSEYISHYDGIKTGTTTQAGACLVSAATTVSGHELIAVIFGVPIDSVSSVFIDSRMLLSAAAAALPPAGTETVASESEGQTTASSELETLETTVPEDSPDGLVPEMPMWCIGLLLATGLVIIALFLICLKQRRQLQKQPVRRARRIRPR